MRIAFRKMAGAGNDFIVIDNRQGIVREEGRRELFARWCARRVGIGADGVLLVEPPADGGDFRMRYYNADGGEAESCGNGARCIARFAHLIGAAGREMAFETQAGLYRAVVGERDVVLSMSDPRDLRRAVQLDIPGLFKGEVDYINTGVPHVVVMVNDLEQTPVFDLGRAIRHHAAFAPAGANANFIRLRPDDENGGGIDIRTYERGVEDETLACGTGSVAAALVASLHGHGRSPVSVYTRGGPILRIHFAPAAGGTGFTAIKLEGEARVVYEGIVEV
ncbi:MAG: diaminopimelate epimerase [bacterium]|nr:diaminopimelate epimerase [bacterium]